MIARLNPPTRATEGEPIELVVDTRRQHILDPHDGTPVYTDEPAAPSKTKKRSRNVTRSFPYALPSTARIRSPTFKPARSPEEPGITPLTA